ncbi:hypothetical protein [Pseudomonas fluorescens]|uniref:Uncharacterized protein n=2 Tax=Pseudomonas fluorescens TaxID=294 RepID=A0ABY1TE07_PSEFL|nr:hypothetical protein [Pseudomonas fluorescens]MCI4605330.1 hypothetical protein [Pseudomonas fluorescens]PQB00167.1 hypothetical protein B0A76_14050 [Pseudomonas fluorescens]RFP96772.1 hypothetical protein D0N73_07690 [Pseudomonas fluorescens]TWR48666.1 hypothetical protein FIP59_07335 [Pseudomonas fluorescens]UKJ70363.1 hypothetical protein H1Q68_07685 [Pseudomonas fluorescens]
MSDKLLKLVKRLHDAALDLYHEPVRSHVPVDRSDLKEIVEDWSRLVSENLTERLEVARLKAEIEAIRKDKSEPCDGCFMADAEAQRTDAERFQFIANDAESSLERAYGDDWLAMVDQLRSAGVQP